VHGDQPHAPCEAGIGEAQQGVVEERRQVLLEVETLLAAGRLDP
jgi:hypothetical protein